MLGRPGRAEVTVPGFKVTAEQQGLGRPLTFLRCGDLLLAHKRRGVLGDPGNHLSLSHDP